MPVVLPLPVPVPVPLPVPVPVLGIDCFVSFVLVARMTPATLSTNRCLYMESYGVISFPSASTSIQSIVLIDLSGITGSSNPEPGQAPWITAFTGAATRRE